MAEDACCLSDAKEDGGDAALWGRRVSGGMMTEDVNKERLASGVAAGFFFVCVSVALKKRPRGGDEIKSTPAFFCFWQINMCIIDQRERESYPLHCLIQAKSSSRPHVLVCCRA